MNQKMKKTATSNNIKSKDKIFEEVFSEFKKAFNKTVDKEVSKLIETTNYLKKSKNTYFYRKIGGNVVFSPDYVKST